MTAMKKITPDDILDTAAYTAERKTYKARQREIKKDRRIDVGPYVSFYFENRETMWHQVQEMLYIEKGGAEQLADELEAYNPLVPQGRDLRCTMMIEIDDEARRAVTLRKLGWIDEKIVIRMGVRTVRAEPLHDTERTTPDGKTSSVHFLRFPFAADQIAAFRTQGADVVLSIEHPRYGHMAKMPDTVREALSRDFD